MKEESRWKRASVRWKAMGKSLKIGLFAPLAGLILSFWDYPLGPCATLKGSAFFLIGLVVTYGCILIIYTQLMDKVNKEHGWGKYKEKK